MNFYEILVIIFFKKKIFLIKIWKLININLNFIIVLLKIIMIFKLRNYLIVINKLKFIIHIL